MFTHLQIKNFKAWKDTGLIRLQAADSKWLRWWPDLQAAGVSVQFLCPDDVCRFYEKKFPDEPVPALP